MGGGNPTSEQPMGQRRNQREIKNYLETQHMNNQMKMETQHIKFYGMLQK